jgi:hypothetical protein
MKLKKVSGCWTVDGNLHGLDGYGVFYRFGKKNGKSVVKDDIIVSFRHGVPHGHRRVSFPKGIETHFNGRMSGISYRETISFT